MNTQERAELLSNLAARGVDVTVTADGIRLTPGAIRRYQLSKFSTAALIEEAHKRGLCDAEGRFTPEGESVLRKVRADRV